MKINLSIKTTGLASTPALVDFIQGKVNQLERFLNKEDEVQLQVEIGKVTAHHKSGEVFRAEFNLTANGETYRAVETREDLYAAIDIVKDEILSQIRNRHDKKHSRLVRGGRRLKDFFRGLKPWK